MQEQAAIGLFDFVFFWLFSGCSLLGLPPGERDPSLLKAVPPSSLAYFEWASRGAGQTGAEGVEGFAADPEIRQFFEMLDAAIAKRDADEPDESLGNLPRQMPQLIKLVSAHPGCLFLGYEPIHNQNGDVATWHERLIGLRAGVILASGHDTETTWQLLNRQLESLPDYRFDAKSMTQSIPIVVPGYKLVMHREGQTILFALGEGTLQQMLAGLSGKTPGMESNSRFQKSLERVAVPRVSTLGWIDGQAIISSVTDILGPLGVLVRPILSMVGADAIDHVVQTSGVENGTMVQRVFVSTGGRTDGLMVLAGGKSIEARQFAHVPADADLVLATSFSLKRVYQEARRVLTLIQPLSVRVFDEAIKQLEGELELRIVDDVLPAFGDTLVAFDSPTNGGLIATSLVASIEIADPEKASRVFERLMKLIEFSLTSDQPDLFEIEVKSLRQQSFLNHTIFYIHATARGYGVDATISPTFCLTDRHLLFAVHPQAMKAQLRYLASKKPSFEIQKDKAIARPKGDLLTYAYLNGPRANGLMAAAIPYLSSAWIGRLEIEGISLDSFSIPSAVAISSYFGDSSAIVNRQSDGLFVETRNAPPVAVSIALLAAYRAWHYPNEEFLEEARHRRADVIKQVRNVREANEVDPAIAESKKPASDTPNSKQTTVQKLAPILIRALLPDQVQSMIPESTLRQIQEGPPPETIQRREDARRKREERRKKRLEQIRDRE